jgi:transcription initiation factor IIE alpha subunit
MYSPIVLPFFLQYLMNAKYIISSRSITSKSKLMISNNFIYIWSFLDRRMLDKILYEVNNSDIPR